MPERSVVTLTTDLTGNVQASVEEPGQPKKDITMFTRAQLVEMPTDEFNELVGTDATKWNKAVLSIAMARRAAE